MTVVMTAILASFRGYPGVAMSCVVLGGLLQIVFGYLKLGSFIRWVLLCLKTAVARSAHQTSEVACACLDMGASGT